MEASSAGMPPMAGRPVRPIWPWAAAPPFVQVAVGKENTCAIRSDSSLWCWGGNSYGQLLLSGTSNRLTPVAVAGAVWSQVACGQSHACAVSNQATLSCWGNNGSGQLGATAFSLGWQTDVPGGPWQSVATGIYQTCAIAQDSTLWCWGDNTNGQLGTGNTNSECRPSPGHWARLEPGQHELLAHLCREKRRNPLVLGHQCQSAGWYLVAVPLVTGSGWQ